MFFVPHEASTDYVVVVKASRTMRAGLTQPFLQWIVGCLRLAPMSAQCLKSFTHNSPRKRPFHSIKIEQTFPRC
jgi:hypothetical protein